jgi:hypothetical protein
MLSAGPIDQRRKERADVCCDHLVCAGCARPVADASCPVCRSARAQLHGAPMSVPALVLALAVLLALALLLATHA